MKTTSRRHRLPLVLLSATVVACLVVAVLVFVPRMRGTSAEVDVPRGGGPVTSPDGAVTVEVPAGAAGTVTFATGEGPQERTTPLGAPLGEAHDITPSEPLQGAEVRFAVDLAEASRAAGETVTGDEVYIGVWEEEFQAWVPLASRYDASTGEVVTRAPHFSWYSTFTEKPAAWWRSYFPETDAADAACGHPPADWTVTVDDEFITACLDERDDGTWVRLHNSAMFPWTVQPPAGAVLGTPPSDERLNDMLVREVANSTGLVSLPWRGSTEFKLPAGFQAGSVLRLAARPDTAGTALNLLWAAVDMVPGSAALQKEGRAAVRDAVERSGGRGLSVDELLDAVAGSGHLASATEAALVLKEAYRCGKEGTTNVLGDDDQRMETALKALAACASTGLNEAKLFDVVEGDHPVTRVLEKGLHVLSAVPAMAQQLAVARDGLTAVSRSFASTVQVEVRAGTGPAGAATRGRPSAGAGIAGQGVLMATCTPAGFHLALVDPSSGSVEARLSVPPSARSETAGTVYSALACDRSTEGKHSDDWRYVVAAQADSFTASRHVGVLDLQTGGFVDATALTEPTGFSSVTAYDQDPEIVGSTLTWVRNRSQVWQMDLGTRRATLLPVAPDLGLRTTDQHVEHSPSGARAASARCPVGTCDTDGRYGEDGNLFVFPSGPSDDGVVQGYEVADRDGPGGLTVGPWLDERRLVLGDGTARTLAVVDVGAAGGRPTGDVPTLTAVPLIPANNHLNYDVTPSPDGEAVAFLSTDDRGRHWAYRVSTDGSQDLEELPLSAGTTDGWRGMPRLLSWR